MRSAIASSSVLLVILACAIHGETPTTKLSLFEPSTPATAATTAPATAPATITAAQRTRVLVLTRKSFQLFKAKDYPAVEKVLAEALEIDPTQSTNLYNMACAQSLLGKPDAALKWLEKSAEAGFTDFYHVDRDSDLDSVRKLDGYKALVARRDELQRRAADLVVERLKQQFGPGYLYEISEPDRLIFATNTDQRTLEELKTTLQKQARSQWATLFDHKVDEYVAVVLPSLEDYRRIVANPNIGGFYNPENHTLIAKRLGTVMAHEFTHALQAADLDATGTEPPIWVREGLAVMFEAANFDGKSFTIQDGQRLYQLQAAAKMNQLIPVEKLLAMSHERFMTPAYASRAYAESGSLMHFLHERGLLRKFLDAIAGNNEDKDPTCREALEKVTGGNLAVFEHDWRAWMVKRTPPPLNTGPGGVFLGVRFGEDNDGLLVEEVVPGYAGAQSGIKVKDVIIGVDGIDVRDNFQLMPLLASHKPGEKIEFRIRRGEEYIDLPVTLGQRPEGPATRPARGRRLPAQGRAPTNPPATMPATAPATTRRAA